MSKKIYLSPSNQTQNPYAAGNTTEDVQCGRIAAACKTALERCGFEVKVGQYDTMANRCSASDSWGADLHVPIHTNAYNGKVSGTRIICYSLSGAGYTASKAVFNALAPITPGTSENISANPSLYEIKHPSAPTVYIEAEFHDVPSVATWIINNVVAIGEAICKGICNYFGVEYKTDEPTPEPTPTPTTKTVKLKDADVFAAPPVMTNVTGTFTIVEESGSYGKLKSGAGWVKMP